jgi:hypothetical protein
MENAYLFVNFIQIAHKFYAILHVINALELAYINVLHVKILHIFYKIINV